MPIYKDFFNHNYKLSPHSANCISGFFNQKEKEENIHHFFFYACNNSSVVPQDKNYRVRLRIRLQN